MFSHRCLAYYRRFKKITILLFSALLSQFFFNRRLLSQADRKSLKKILILSPPHVGDAILTFPLISTLKHNFPQAKITIAAPSGPSHIYRQSREIDKIIEHSPQNLKLWQRLKFIKKLAKDGFDLIFDDMMTFDSMLFSVLNGGRFRCDRGSLRLRQIFRRENMLAHRAYTHRSRVQLDALSLIGIGDFYENIHLNTNRIQDQKARDFLGRYSLRKEDWTVVLHLGAALGIKCWEEERFAELGRILADRYDAKIIIIGSKDEIEKAKRVQAQAEREFILAAGETDLDTLIGILKHCNLFIGNDSGPSHIASALDTPSIIICGPMNPQAVRHGRHSHVLENAVSCRKPCLYIASYVDYCHLNKKCTDVPVKQVLALIDQIREHMKTN